MHHMCCASCGEYRVLMLVSGFPVSIEFRKRVGCEDPFDYVGRLLHGGILLPSEISGKMIISPDTITIIAMLVYRFYQLCLVAYHMLNISLSTMT